jgi:hypothetical protein
MEQYFGTIKEPVGTLLGTPTVENATNENGKCSQAGSNLLN